MDLPAADGQFVPLEEATSTLPPDLEGVAIHDPDAEPVAPPRRRGPLILIGLLGGIVVLGGGAFALEKTGLLSAALGKTGTARSGPEQSLRDSVAGLVAQRTAPPQSTTAPDSSAGAPPILPPPASAQDGITAVPSPAATPGAPAAGTPGDMVVPPTVNAPAPDTAALAQAAREAAARQMASAPQPAAVQPPATMAPPVDSAKLARVARQEAAREAERMRKAQQDSLRQVARQVAQARLDSLRQAAQVRRDSIREARRLAAAAKAAPVAPVVAAGQPQPTPGAPMIASPTPSLPSAGVGEAKPRPRPRPENLAWDDPRAPWNRKKKTAARMP